MILVLNAFSDHALYLYKVTKCHENISKGLRVMEGLDFQYSKFSKGQKSVQKIVGRSMVLLAA